MEKALWYIFILSLVLIALAYYVGVQTDAPALAAAIQQIVYAVTGRNKKGDFAGYAQNPPVAPTAG